MIEIARCMSKTLGWNESPIPVRNLIVESIGAIPVPRRGTWYNDRLTVTG